MSRHYTCIAGILRESCAHRNARSLSQVLLIVWRLRYPNIGKRQRLMRKRRFDSAKYGEIGRPLIVTSGRL